MNFKKLKYKIIATGLIVVTFFSSGCKDFLDRDVEDGFGTGSVTDKEQYLHLTAALYGGRLWADYNAKFSWCVNEGLAGNLYNIFEDEGAIFLGNIAATNTVLEKGYRSLYGVISVANSIINKNKSTLSGPEANEIEAEARMFRGMCYFLLTEYFGEVPLVWNNEYCIANNIKVPKATRETLYKAIESDWRFAEQYLPSSPVKPGRVTTWSAKGMLAKLYLTMASCQTSGLKCPYECGSNSTRYYEEAVKLATQVITSSGASLVDYKDIFDFDKRTSCPESLFALYYEDGEYGAGSQYQCQLAKNDFWSPAAGWGTGKSLTWTLYKSYDNRDLRKNEVCMYAGGGEKVTVGGNDYMVYLNYKGAYETERRGRNEYPKPYGKEELSGSYALNNIKKYVYGYGSTIDKMSCPMRLDFLRLADVYLIRAEANMALETQDAATPASAGAWKADLKIVLERHAGPTIAGLIEPITEMAFYTHVAEGTESYTYTGNDGSGNAMNVTVTVPSYGNTVRTDFIQERRKEFAIEGQGWLDVKRLYYRNPQYAKDFFKEQDRVWTRNQKRSADDLGINLAVEDGYVRLKLFNQLLTSYPEINDKIASEEPDVSSALANGNFDTWFLPLPARVSTEIPGGSAQNFVSDIERGTYPY